MDRERIKSEVKDEVKLDELYSLIDRLHECGRINNPTRYPWSNEFYYHCAFAWKDKLGELKTRVLELEEKANIKH